jgi:hypothetical protein
MSRKAEGATTMKMMRVLTLLAIAALPLRAASADDFHWRGRIAAGQAIEIKGVNGDVEAEPAGGPEVEVVATKTARRSDPASVEIKVVEHAGGVTICAVYPSRSTGSPNECAPGDGGRMNTNNNDVNVRFQVRVPSGVRFVAQTVNGGVAVRELEGDVEVATVNGGITASSRGLVRAETVNGSVTASLGQTDWTGSLSLKTVNGSLTVELPDGASADVRASTVNGGITTDFPLTVKGKWGPKHLDGTLGSGGRQLELETVNGGIRLKKRG